MICTSCQFANPDAARFCGGCGRALPERCAACGTTAISGASFCHQCGKPLGNREAIRLVVTPSSAGKQVSPPIDSSVKASAHPEDAHPSLAELRHITVMFVDIVESTALSQRLDLESYREVLASFQRYVEKLAPEFHGHVAQFMGDGAMIYFGYPVAREDAVDCAIHCGTEMSKTASDLGGQLTVPGITIGLRMTISSGSVVADESVRADGTFSKNIFGDVPNIAERLKPLAQSGDVVVSAATRRLASRFFRFTDLGEHQVKGVEAPVHAFRVEGLSPGNLANPMVDTSIIGRGAEIGLLNQRWASAVEGDSQMALLSGEAGIGKSALVQMLRSKVASEGGREIVLAGTAIRSNSAYRVLRSGMENLLGIGDADTDAIRRDAIARFLRSEGLDHGAFAPALETLLDCHTEEELQGTADSAPREVNSALCRMLLRLSRNVPLLIVVEDLHWIDPSSREFLTDFAFLKDPGKWLLVATFRPDFSPTWLARPNVTSLTIGRLSQRDTTRLIELVAGRAMPGEVVEQIIERTDGVPLFVEELTKNVLESGLLTDDGQRYTLKGALPALAIPESLQDSLMARLDRLSTVKDVAQVAAAIGRRFPLDLLRQVAEVLSGREASTLDDALEKLVDAELIFRLRSYPNTEFEFKHALVQDAAYQSLLRSARQKWHRRIAEAIEAGFAQIVNDEPEILAHHWTEAQDFSQAEKFWTQAGQVALARSANLEAIGHFRRALECLGELQRDRERDQREFNLLISIAVPLASSRGYADNQVREVYSRAEALGVELGADTSVFPIVYGVFRSRMIGGDQTSALDYAKRVQSIAQRSGNRGHIGAAMRSMGSALFYSGAPEEALPHLLALEDLDLSEDERRDVLSYDVVDLNVAGAAYRAWVHWNIGDADMARADASEAIRRADESGHLFSRALSRAFGSWTHEFCGDFEEAGALSEEVLDISRENGLDFWIGWAEVMVAAARNSGTAPAEIERGIETWLSTGSRLGLSYFLWLRARALIGLGEVTKAEAALDAALEDMDRSGEAWWRPEVFRLRAQLTDDSRRAADLIEEALELARGMSSNALALRAATDLAALPGHAPGPELEALLVRVEAGGATADTRRARSLIAEREGRLDAG